MEIFCRAPTLNRGAGYELSAICRPSPSLGKDSAMESKASVQQYVFVSRELMNLRFIQNIIMTGLSNSFIANTDRVQCTLYILWFNVVLASNSPFLCFHIIIIATVQRKFFVYLPQILLPLVGHGRDNTFRVSLHFNSPI